MKKLKGFHLGLLPVLVGLLLLVGGFGSGRALAQEATLAYGLPCGAPIF